MSIAIAQGVEKKLEPLKGGSADAVRRGSSEATSRRFRNELQNMPGGIDLTKEGAWLLNMRSVVLST